MEGKEVRFGPAASGDVGGRRRPARRTGRSTRCTTAITPLGGGGRRWSHMMLGEVSPGGVGVGLNGLLIMVILSVFIAGLMVGRTPEYLGKKIQARRDEARRAVHPGHAARRARASPRVSMSSTRCQRVDRCNPGPHGLTEILYAFTSAANNNGSAFAASPRNTTGTNTTLGLAMLVGRFFLIIPVLAIAGSLARKQPVPAVAGHVPDPHAAVRRPASSASSSSSAGLTFFPALALGPIVEQLVASRSHDAVHDPRSSGPSQQRTRPSPAAAPVAVRPGHRPAARRRQLPQARPPQLQARNPVMFVVLVGSVLTTILFFRDLGDSTAERERVRRPGRACSCGSPCCSPTSPRRWPRAAARRRPTRCARPAPRPSPTGAVPDGAHRGGRRHRSCDVGDECVVDGRRGDPRRRRRHRGHRHGRRVGHHRRVGARSSASPAATARRSPAAPGCCPTRSSCASPPGRARRSSTA